MTVRVMVRFNPAYPLLHEGPSPTKKIFSRGSNKMFMMKYLTGSGDFRFITSVEAATHRLLGTPPPPCHVLSCYVFTATRMNKYFPASCASFMCERPVFPAPGKLVARDAIKYDLLR